MRHPGRRIEPSSISLVSNLLDPAFSVKTILICLKGVLRYPVQLLFVPERTERK